MPTILRSAAPARDAHGDYSKTMARVEQCFELALPNKKRNAELTIEQYVTLLLAAVGADMYKRRGNPVIQPWLLWKIWQWVTKATPMESLDSIFDFMPNWGE